MYSNEYPTWEEIRGEVSAEELLEIIDVAKEVGLDVAIQDYIEATYEAESVLDIDAAYDAMRDDLLTA